MTVNSAVTQGSGKMLVLLFSFSLFVSAALMFSVQPMIGKMLLPVVGGTPSGWIVALAFFQLALLAGYLGAYFLSALSVRRHALLYLALLALGAVVLPLHVESGEGATTLDSVGTFALLLTTLGLPFVALSMTATTLQRLFGASGHSRAHDPYFLYAASNLGSFAGLIAYPFMIEPYLSLATQSNAWMAGYIALIALGLVCLALLRKATGQPAQSDHAPVARLSDIPWQRRLRWVAYAFIPASLLMGYTAYITRDLYAAPMMWVWPLAIYLLTFVAAFRSPPLLTAARLAWPQLLATALSLGVISVVEFVLRGSLLPVVVHLVCFAVIALTLHLRLYEDRPNDNSRQMAAFYLHLSIGGALAGVFCAFIAPLIFNMQLELPLILIASLLLHPWLRKSFTKLHYALLAVGVLVAVAYGYAHYAPDKLDLMAMRLVMAVGLVIASGRPLTLLICGALALSIWFHQTTKFDVYRARNFYGSIVVYDEPAWSQADGRSYQGRYLNHGTTIHGFQILDAKYELTATSYYGALVSAFNMLEPKRVAVLGLGAGMINCIGNKNIDMTFVEIDPSVVKAAKGYFTFLEKCRERTAPRILMGDGRLVMQGLKDEKFDAIIVDVFSSDSIPAHMMTREALAVYLDRLTPDGVVFFHISNFYYELAPALNALGKDAGLAIALRFQTSSKSFLDSASEWVAFSRNPATLERLRIDGWAPNPKTKDLDVWTDDYSNVLAVMRGNFSNSPLAGWLNYQMQNFKQKRAQQ